MAIPNKKSYYSVQGASVVPSGSEWFRWSRAFRQGVMVWLSNRVGTKTRALLRAPDRVPGSIYSKISEFILLA